MTKKTFQQIALEIAKVITVVAVIAIFVFVCVAFGISTGEYPV